MATTRVGQANLREGQVRVVRTEIMRPYRFTLDPTPAQAAQFESFAGTARAAFNHALRLKLTAQAEWSRQVNALVETGVDKKAAKALVRVPMPRKFDIQKELNQVKGDNRTGKVGPFDWWSEVSSWCFLSAFADADTAWKNWMDSCSGKRKGPKVRIPKLKLKRTARKSFRIHHQSDKPAIRMVTYRRLRVPTLGEIRIHDSGKKLSKAVARGDAVITSVTISKGGHRWYASVLTKVMVDIPDRPSRAQRAAGTVGVDLGVKVLAALSTGEMITNPRHVNRSASKLARAQRRLSAAKPGSNRRKKAAARVARLQHLTAARRATMLHAITTRLAKEFAVTSIEDLNVAGMTSSAKGTVENPGKNVAQKAGLNRQILDAGFGEFRRQLNYKTFWYGSKVAVLDRWYPSSKTCSDCGWRKSNLRLSDREFRCDNCGLIMDRDTNAALNIARHAVIADTETCEPAPITVPASGTVAPSTEETLNARRESAARPCVHGKGGSAAKSKREDPTIRFGPPHRSNPVTFQHAELALVPA